MYRDKVKIINEIAKEHQLSQDDTEVILFGFNLLVNSIIGFGAILVVAYVFGIFTPVLIASITSAVFRTFTGGTHANSPVKCIVFGACIFNIIGLITVGIDRIFSIANYIWLIPVGTFIIALISFYLYAPADTPGKPITAKVQRKRLRLLAFSFLIIWGIILGVSLRGATMQQHLVLASCLGLIWQSVSLWPITYRLFGHK